jgi:carbamoylphosphate synthase large subunit
MIISSGPIVIGQGCEFDYSGTQACKALREEGIQIVLLNSNPATIMTDPEMADRTYIEPITPESIDKILGRERELGTPVDALLPTLGGQTGLNCAMEAAEAGILRKHNVQLIGANEKAIHKAEDRTEFKNAMLRIGLDVPRSGIAHTWEESLQIVKEVGLPVCIRPAYTLGGSGGGFATTMQEFEPIAKRGIEYSRVSEILIEESCLGWKEYELEVMRDRADNVVIICSIENFDPMGVHTGDSITVAPAQTLTDKEYQLMRDAAIKIIREIGVDTGGSNIQFAIHPDTGRMIVIEMNPRVSRSSALASKATGYPIAKIAAKLAIGYTLDEIPNDITKKTPASFEPTIDYCVVKIPRWTFEKFPEANETLTTQMKSVGEAMSIGRTFKEALQKGIRSMEIKRFGLGLDDNDAWLSALRAEEKSKQRKVEKSKPECGTGVSPVDRCGTGVSPVPVAPGGRSEPAAQATGPASMRTSRLAEAPADTKEQHAAQWPIPLDILRDKLERPCQGRPYYIRYAFKMGWTVEQVFELTRIDPWFLENMKTLVDFEEELTGLAQTDRPNLERCFDLFEREWQVRLRIADGKFDPSSGLDWPRPDTQEEAERYTALVFRIRETISKAKQWGYSDKQLATVLNVAQDRVRAFRHCMGIEPVYKLVDTCAAEFEAYTPYYYSSYESPCTMVDAKAAAQSSPAGSEAGRYSAHRIAAHGASSTITCDDEVRISDKPKVIILGGGPNRIGQGIEFDYCCVHAVMAARKLGYETVMVNSNPETVSTDYDTSDLLFFEPLTHEDVLNICERLNGGALHSAPVVDLSGECSISDESDSIYITGPGFPSRQELFTLIEQTANRHNLGQVAFLQFGSAEPYHYTCVADRSGRVWEFGYDLTKKNSKEVSVEPFRELENFKLADYCGEDTVRRMQQFTQGLLKGVIVQFGGQTPLNLAMGLKKAGVPILGTTPESIDLAEDRDEFAKVLKELGLRQPENGIAYDLEGAIAAAKRISYPVLVRPSYVLGGRAMEKCHIEEDLVRYMQKAMDATDRQAMVDDAHPILIDKFLDAAIEVDVDCISDGQRAVVCGVMEHIEEAGIHSGDSACALPPYSLPPRVVDEIKEQTAQLAKRLGVRGLMNVQFAVKHQVVYVLEVNPRASRTVPFVSKATGVPWAKLATEVMLGKSLDHVMAAHGLTDAPHPRHISVKESVFPFNKFPEVDCILGPEMRSTGEVMGIDRSFALAFAKAQMAASVGLPKGGTVLISVNDHDKPVIVPIARQFAQMGFKIISTLKTLEALQAAGIEADLVHKKQDPLGPYLIDMINNGQVHLLINTPIYWGSSAVESRIRSAAVMHNIPLITTITGARAAAQAIKALREGEWGVRSIQEYHAEL